MEIVEAKAMEAKASREKGDPSQPGSVSAPMSGEVIKINAQAGEKFFSPLTQVEAFTDASGIPRRPHPRPLLAELT